MARRGKHQGTIVLAAVIIGGIAWLFDKGASILKSAGGANVLAIFAVVVMAIVCWVFGRKLLASRREKLIEQSLLKKVYVATQEHLAALVRKRMQLVQSDAYGNQKLDKWTEEIRYFLFDHLGPSLSPEELSVLAGKFPALIPTIDSVVQSAARDDPSLRAFSDDMSPTEFEAFCAEELRQAGWNARVTLQSRDQGVDVIAEKNGARVVLQCKLYTGPVGNKAVQEAAAGKAHERADYGIVVTNNRYTSAAEQLASTNGVLLLHYRDLRTLDAILPRHVSGSAPLAANFDRARWDALLKRDPQLATVADKLQTLGQKWVDKFAASYLAANDRSRLPTLVGTIIADARKEFEQGNGST
jgi:restriction system protein